MGSIGATPSPKGIDKFAWVEPWLARGAQPSILGYKWLDAHGFKVLVNLRIHDESKTVRRFAGSVEPIQIPITNNRAPSEEQALQFLEICASRYMRPILVHCNLGEGRTSTFCALIRVAQGWPLDEAIREQQPFGFDPSGEHQEQAHFLRSFVLKKLAERVWVPDSFPAPS